MKDGGTLARGFAYSLVAIVLGGIFLFLLYWLLIFSIFAAALVGIAGFFWGGGTAFLNYVDSMRENLYDSNKK